MQSLVSGGVLGAPEQTERQNLQRRNLLTFAAWYWSMPVALLGRQAADTHQCVHQVRSEELAESMRNVQWLEHRAICDGLSRNVGW